jgi:hypothetical protein
VINEKIFQYWSLKNEPFLWESMLGEVRDLEIFKDSLEDVLGKESFIETIKKESSQQTSFDTLDSENGDLFNSKLVHAGSAGKIRPINFLEAELLNYQLARYPLLSHPTEFQGFLLFNESKDSVKVYFAASDQPWPPKPAVILESIEKDLKQGWTLEYHLHNHYEPKTNNYLGILAPSLADAQFFSFLSEDYGLDKALITNGFHTVEIESKEFPKFKSHGSQ